jgi:hypothetical protein
MSEPREYAREYPLPQDEVEFINALTKKERH